MSAGCGPGKRWGHTCTAIRGGKLLYVFGGYAGDNCQTNKLHLFDTATQTWSEPMTKGTPPTPRDSHSCTTVGDNLFVFGGTDGKSTLKDLHVLDISLNTWISPTVRGDIPDGREGHSSSLIGKQLFIFGGSGKASSNSDQEFYNDLFILNTETFVWKRLVTSGSIPAKRDSHTCSSWKNKIIVIGGEDSFDYYLSDVHILDTDTLVWTKLNTAGHPLPPRAGHTTVALGKNLFVFGGFTDESNLYDDLHMLDIDTSTWTKVITTGERPSARFSMAGESLDPQKEGVLVFFAGCNKSLEALDDMYYLHTGLRSDNERLEKLSLRKQMKMKCQEQSMLVPPINNIRIETNANICPPIPMPRREIGYPNVGTREYLPFPGKRTFHAKVTSCFPVGYSIETVIDGKPLRGILFSNKSSLDHADENSKRRKVSPEFDGAKLGEDQEIKSEPAALAREDKEDNNQTDIKHGKIVEVANDTMKSPTPSEATQAHEVSGNLNESAVAEETMEDNAKVNISTSSPIIHELNLASHDNVDLSITQGERSSSAAKPLLESKILYNQFEA